MKKLKYCLLAILCPVLCMAQMQSIRGKVLSEENQPIPRATITIKSTNLVALSDEEGAFTISYSLTTIDHSPSMLVISAVGYETVEETIGNRTSITVTLKRKIGELDEVIMQAYGTTTRRLNTGSIAKVAASQIAKQPVSDPMAALQGRIPGLIVQQNSGIAGARFTIQVRGKNSLSQGTDPLYVIDGIPFGEGNTSLSQLSNAATLGLSPFNTINPADIESIEVLKDADATAIYGSRGANGVILITTKKGKAGKTNYSISVKSGVSRVTRSMAMLNTQQYLQMRREAFANDGISPTVENAPDLLVWDTTKFTDFKKMFTGGTASTNDAQASVSAGNQATNFLLNVGYHKETGLLSNTQASLRKSLHFNLNHASTDRRFILQLTTGYSTSKSDLLNNDLAAFINIAPHFPLYDAAGQVNWLSGTTPLGYLGLQNPLGQLQRKYLGRFQNLIGNLALSYKISQAFSLKMSQGFQTLNGEEENAQPVSSLDPALGQLASANFSNNSFISWQTEPQVEYLKKWGKTKLAVLVGGTLQEMVSRNKSVFGYNYTNDLLLSSINAAGNLVASNGYSQYKYAAFFGRVNYNLHNSYILNLTARRDGSSRFGPANQFANFGAVGFAWIFSDQKWIQKHLPFISFGKWRASYGITGNDRIGDYKHLDTWSTTSNNYQGVPGLQPTRLFNADYGWEQNKKWEIALELGLFNDRLLWNTSFYLHRSGNQLVNYTLPIQTGFSSVLQNFGALIQNSGFEFSIQSKNITGPGFNWSSSFNLTIPRNRLIAFPGLENTSYKSLFEINQPISMVRLYQYTGIDSHTGIYLFNDVDNNGRMDNSDRIKKVNTDPSFFGGFSNGFSFKNIQLDVFIEFKKQIGKNYLATQSAFIPGYFYYNQPVIVLQRWQNPDSAPLVQKFVASALSPAFEPAQSFLPFSDAIYSDASFIRLKNISLNYSLPAKLSSRLHSDDLSFFLQARNLFTLTSYIGADPENQNLYILPPLKTIIAGIRFNF